MTKAVKKRTGKIDVEFTEGMKGFGLHLFFDCGTLVYGSPIAKNRKGVAFDTPGAMIQVAECMKLFAENWKKALEVKDESV